MKEQELLKAKQEEEQKLAEAKKAKEKEEAASKIEASVSEPNSKPSKVGFHFAVDSYSTDRKNWCTLHNITYRLGLNSHSLCSFPK